MTTPRGAPEMTTSQNLKEETFNEGIRRTEAGACHFPVTDRVTAPPGSCADGANYLIIATATGAFASKETQIATAVGANAASGWYYHTPIEGFTAWVMDEDAEYRYSGSAWATVAAPASAAVAADIWAGTDATKYVTADALQDASALIPLTSGATITPDFATGFNFSLTLAHNATLANPSNLQAGDSGVIAITQDGTGSRTLAYDSQWKFPGGAPVLSTAAGAKDMIAYVAVSGSEIWATLSKAFSS